MSLDRIRDYLDEQDGKRIGLIMAGSGARLGFYLGAVMRMREAGIVPSMIAGVSGGAIVGAAWAVNALGAFNEVYSAIRSRDVAYTGSPLLRGIRRQESLYSTEALSDLIYRYLDPYRLQIPFVAGTVRLSDGRYHAWEFLPSDSLRHKGDLPAATLASASIPVIAPTVKIAGDRYYDGGARHTIGDIHKLRGWGVLDEVFILLAQSADHPPDEWAKDEPPDWFEMLHLHTYRSTVYTLMEDIEDIREWQDADEDVHLIDARSNLGSGMDFSYALMQKRYVEGQVQMTNFLNGYRGSA